MEIDLRKYHSKEAAGNFTLKKKLTDLPGGAVVRSLSANVGDAGLVPGPGGFHKLQEVSPMCHN